MYCIELMLTDWDDVNECYSMERRRVNGLLPPRMHRAHNIFLGGCLGSSYKVLEKFSCDPREVDM